jgi:hypothetical protein
MVRPFQVKLINIRVQVVPRSMHKYRIKLFKASFWSSVVLISFMSNIFVKVSISPVVEKNLDHILLLDDITGKEFVKLCSLIGIFFQLLFIENVPVLRKDSQINSLFKISFTK